MSEPHERLQEARKAAGYDNASAAAKAFGWTTSTYLGHENASRGLSASTARVYATAFGADAAWIIYGDGERPQLSPLAQRIDDLMRAKNLNPRRAALMAGVGQDYVRDIMRGRVLEPSGGKLAALAAVLGCSTGWLLTGSDDPVKPRPEANGSGEKLNERASGDVQCSIAGVSALTTGRVTLDLKANVSMGVAAQILALIEGDKP